MGEYFNSIWRCRYFWLSLVKNDLRTRYRRSVLGMGWSLLHPIAMTAVLTVVFTQLFGQDPKTYAPMVLAGLACWNYIRTVTIQGCQCLFQGEPYIRQYPAPLAIYPLRAALGEMVHFIIALFLVLVLSWFFNGFSNLHTLFCLLPTIVLLFILGWSLAVLAGFANVHFQDTQHLCEVGFQILFYATPVMYTDEFLQKTSFGWLLYYNPLRAFLKMVREPILVGGNLPTLTIFSVASLTALLAFAAASLVLLRCQRRLIFHL